MKHRTITIALVTALLLFLMVWSFGSRAANNQPAGKAPIEGDEARESSAPAPAEGDDANDDDADLGKWGSRSNIDREEYLRLRDEYIGRKRGIEPGRPFDPSMRAQAIDRMDRQEKNRKIESLVNGSLTPPIGTDAAWTPLGPSPLPNGGGSIAVSGRATVVVVDPTNSSKVYLGTAQGGVWRSLDGGATWVSIFDNAQSLAIGALALAPSDPTILYVGTGEFNGCGDCFFGVGLYRIDTVDTTPSLVGPINPSQTISNFTYNIFNGRGITKIVVDPNNPATIFVATGRGVGGSGANSLGLVVGGVGSLATRGLWRSFNATSPALSVTFQKLAVTIDNSPDTPQTGNVDTTDIVMEPGNTSNLLVAVIGTALPGGIFRTTNASSPTPTFSQVLSLPTGVRVSLAINKVGSTVTAYAATSETPTTTPGCTTANSGAVRKSVDGGATWSGQLTGGSGFCAGQCFYDMPIAVDPGNANLVYIGGQTSSTCGRLVGKSTDGGTTFVVDSSGLHADDHSLFFDGFGNIYTGNDGGVWKRSATAITGTAWTNLNNAPLNTMQFEGIAVHPFDRNLMIGGTQDNGTEYQQTSAGNWRGAEGGDGGYALIDQSATDTTNVTMYHTFFNQSGSTGQIGFDRAVNTTCLPVFNFWPTRGVGFGGGSDTEDLTLSCDGTANYKHNGIQLTDAVLFYAPMALGPGSPNTVYFGTDRLYRSTDRGDTMTIVSQGSISSPGSNGSPISTIAISPQDDTYRIVGLQNGQVWATSTGSSTLVNITSVSFPTNPNGSVTNKFVGRAVIDPNNRNVAYIAFSFFATAGQGIWKITNLGAAAGASPSAPVWTAAGAGIPSIPVNALAIDPANSNNIYAGTDIGVYSSTDGGASWTPFGTGLPRSAVFDLALQNANRVLRAGTHGRGIWEIPLSSPSPNQIDTSSFFVRQHYLDFLNREPDTSGLNFWVNNIEGCGADQNCRDVKRTDTSAAFFLSIEFQNTGYLVERIYKAAYGSASGTSTFGSTHQLPVPIIRLAEFLPDTQTIGQGLIVGQTGWETVLENNKQAFVAGFVQRSRFTAPAAYPTSMTPAQFVDKLFLNAGVTPSANDRTAAINEFNGAGSTADVSARSRALRDVAENATLTTNEFNRAFVLMQYFGYLRRDPNNGNGDIDYTGYDFWLTKLNQFGGNYNAAEMVKSFLVSGEYRGRFGTP